MSVLEENKKIVLRFNKEFLEEGNIQSFHELVAKDFINRTAPPEFASVDGMLKFMGIYRKAFADIKIEIFEQIAERDLVTTRKVMKATHVGEFMGMQPSGKRVDISIIDIVKVVNGKYVEHWGIRDMQQVVNAKKD
jgi:predicted ester cyclase